MADNKLESNIFSFSPHFLRILFVLASLTLTVFIIYGNTFDAAFQFDDRQNIVENKAIHLNKLTLENIFGILDFSPSRAVAMFTFSLNYYFDGLDVWGYHLVNTLIHILSAFFLFLFILKTLRLPSVSQSYGRFSYSIALLATFLWAINPVQTQAVTYIVQRMASMAAMFYILSMYFYLEGRISENNFRKWLFFFLCTLTGLLAILTKENAVMLPVSIFLYDLLLFQGISRDSLIRNLKILTFLLLFVFLMWFFNILIREKPLSLSSFLSGYEDRPFTLIQRLLTQPRIIWFYISLLLYPTPDRLTIGHDIWISSSLIHPPSTLLAILFLFALFGAALYQARKFPLICFCILFFLTNHIIESSIIPLELIFEHRNYLPSMMFFLPIAILLVKGVEHYTGRGIMQYFIIAFIIGIIIGQGVSTYIRNFAWKTEYSLWHDAVEKAPASSRNHANMAVEYYKKGWIQEAIHHAERAIQLDRYVRLKYRFHAYSLLGDCYIKLNQTDKAISFYLKANNLKPDPATENNLAMAFMSLGDYEKAKNHLLASLSMEEMAIAHNNLGHILLRQGQIPSAISELKKALQMQPDLVGAYTNLGAAYKSIGLFHQAERHYKKALLSSQHPVPRNPGYMYAYLGLLEVYILSDQSPERMKTADRLVELLLRYPNSIRSFLQQFDDENGFYRSLMNWEFLLEELGRALHRKGEWVKEKGDLYYEKLELLKKKKDKISAPKSTTIRLNDQPDPLNRLPLQQHDKLLSLKNPEFRSIHRESHPQSAHIPH